MKKVKQKERKYNVLDLFCGCGGLSLGFEQAGFHVDLGIDNWSEALKTFKNNHKNSKILSADISKISPKNIVNKISKSNIDVIVGGPPCQGFSISGKRNADDPRNQLYHSFVSFVKYFQPKAFIMENVPNLLAINKGRVKDQIINEFEKIGYKVVYKILLASDFGVPQNRKRVAFVGLKSGEVFEFPIGNFSDSKITSLEAISDLPENELQDGMKYICEGRFEYQKLMRKKSKGIFNHQVTKHTEKTKKIISLVPDGGNYKNLPEHLQGTRKVNIAWTRLNSTKPSFTIDIGHNHHFHYKYNRVPTARESARLQSFPDTFIFHGKKNEQLKQIGNAVPPILGRILAEQLQHYLS